MISTAREAMGPTVITMLMLETVIGNEDAHCVFDLFVWQKYGMLRAPRGAMCARG